MRKRHSRISAALATAFGLLQGTAAPAPSDAPTRVELTIQERAGVERQNWPITQGIPFARGVLKDVSTLALRDETGRAVRLAARPLAWWDAEKTSVRFALVDFQATMAPKTARRFTLSWAAAAPPLPASELTVQDTRDSLTVTSGGGVRAMFSKTQPRLWKELTTGGGPSLKSIDAGTFYVVRQDGTRFTMAAAAKDYALEVEEANPLRVIVKQSGWCASAAGETYCRYTIRHCFYAGKPWIHLRPTLIFTGLWPKEWIKEFGVELKLGAPAQHVRTAADGRLFNIPVLEPDGVLVLQSDDEHFKATAGGRAASARRSDGFVAVGEDARALTVAVRDFWQTHPKAFAIARDTLTVKLWAAESGRELDFDRMWAIRPMVKMADLPGVLIDETTGPFKKSFDEKALRAALAKLEPGTLVNVRMGAAGSKQMAFLPKEMFRRIHAEFGQKLYFFASDWFPFAEPDSATARSGRSQDLNTARGHAKTHDILLAFGGGGGAALAAGWATPAYALAPPAYLCGTGAVGQLRGREPGRFKEFDEALLRAADQAIQNAERFRLNGMWDYGASIGWHNFGGAEFIMDVMGQQPGFRPVTRLGVIDNGSTSPGGGIQRGAWLAAWYTGDPSRFDFALRQTSHLFDVDACHFDLGLPGRRSLGSLGGEGITHWLNWGTIINTCGGVIDHYLFTGDPYALETLRQIAGYTLDLWAEGFKDNYELRLYEYTVRADYLCGELMIEYHRLTWEPRALAMAQDVWRNVQKRPARQLPVLNENYGPHFGWALYDFRPDEHLRAKLIEAADLIVADVAANKLESPNYRFSMRALGRAYEITGDGKYLDAARLWLKGTDQEAALTGANSGLGWPGWPGVATSAIPWIFRALDKEEAEGKGAARTGKGRGMTDTRPP